MKKIYAFILWIIQLLFGIDAAKIFDTKLRFKRTLNLKYPKSLADKVSFIELHEQNPLASICTDKLAVRDYVASKGLADILVPLVGNSNGYTRIEDINFDEFPNSFVLKATHGCKMNYLVPDKSKINYKKCNKEMKRWLKTTYGGYSMEPHYKKIPHRIYAEKYLGDMSQMIDYKIHCLNGKAEFFNIMSDRKANGDKAMQMTVDCYDMDWNPIHEVCGIGAELPGSYNIPKPTLLNEMKQIAEKLAEDFKFVRVDLYQIENKILFGELTFSPAGCVFAFMTEKFLDEMGDKLKL